MKLNRQDEVLEILLQEIAESGWSQLNFYKVAQLADIPLEEMYQLFPDKSAVLHALIRQIDTKALAQIESIPEDESVQDRLFAILMDRFDVMQPHKRVFRVLWQDVWRDPLFFLCNAQKGLNSITWILQASGVETASLLGAVRVKLFAGVYLYVVQTWLQDETEDMAQTMAALDQSLKRLEQIPGFYESVGS